MSELFDVSPLDKYVEIGKKYPIQLGNTNERTLSMQYLFKPASILKQSNGSISTGEVHGSNDVLVDVESLSGVKETFKGTKRKANGNEHEYIMCLNADGFQIKKVDDHILNLRVQREENMAKLKESAAKESKLLLESRKLPKFLRKAPAPKKNALVVAKEVVSRDKEDKPEEFNATVISTEDNGENKSEE